MNEEKNFNTTDEEVSQELPDSVLYEGVIQSIERSVDDKTDALTMESDTFGDYILYAGPETVAVDDTAHTLTEISQLKTGAAVRVFHSPIIMMSLPPRAAAFAVVHHLSDAEPHAQYLKAEEVMVEGNTLKITFNHGNSVITADETTVLPEGETLSQIRKEDCIMVWGGEKSPASHLIRLPRRKMMDL